ncbi:right-handed parallel beta-helix repeat-containing protein [bacterium]|nr:right-handed parallel beta-helix repeat-containing protein [bacterium]
MKSTYLCLILVLAFTCLGYADIIHVPGDQPTIQAGIDAAWHGDTVLVADGTYKGNGNKNLDFKSKIIEVRSENGPEYTTIDCEGDGCGFYFQSGEGTLSVVSGFTITNGATVTTSGGGIICNSSPTIIHNIITANLGVGGIACRKNASPVIIDNIITENASGGVVVTVTEFGAPEITNNIIIDNRPDGIYLGNSGSANITNNIIMNNSQNGIYCDGVSTNITQNIIVSNGNWGIHCLDIRSSPKIINNTISDNSGGGIRSASYSAPTVLNTIIWGNGTQEIELSNATIYVTYSDIKGGWPGEGNIDADPLFIDPGGDFHLSDYSPCIGAGIMTPDVPNTDIDGNPRPNPPGSNPDMGASENPLAEPPGSIDGYVTDLLENPLTALIIAINAETKDKYKTVTDSDGYYEITDLEPNTYWVICIKKGYQAGIARVEVEPGLATPCNFVLRRKS